MERWKQTRLDETILSFPFGYTGFGSLRCLCFSAYVRIYEYTPLFILSVYLVISGVGLDIPYLDSFKRFSEYHFVGVDIGGFTGSSICYLQI